MGLLDEARLASGKKPSTKSKNGKNLSDDEVIDLLMAYFAKEIDGRGLATVLTARGYVVKIGGGVANLAGRIPRLVHEGRLRVIRATQ